MLKNLIVTFSLLIVLIALALFVFSPPGEAQGVDRNKIILDTLFKIPAPPPPNPLVSAASINRPPEFYSLKNPPPDNAPIGDLIDYWSRQRGATPLSYTIEPSPRVMDRLLAEVEKNPGLETSLLSVFSQHPEAADLVKRAYDRVQSDEEAGEYQAEQLKNWLTYNSDYFIDDLIQMASQVRDEDEYVTNQEELLALGRVNFDRAKPILDRLINDRSQPISQTLANWVYYLNALKNGNSIEASGYRDYLMGVVEDKNAMPGNRDLALDALVYGGDFPGRDDWYFRLMEDETLFDIRVNGRTYTGLTTLLMRSPPDKYVDKMIQLVRSSNLTIRSAAARNLATVMKDNGSEVVKALLPWLEDPNWAKQVNGERRLVVTALAEHEIPESVPGLIKALNEKETIEVEDEDGYRYDANVLPPLPRPTPPPGAPPVPKRSTREIYPLRDAAINALMRQRSVQAAAALRQVLPEVEKWKRGDVVKAILLSGGFTIPEQVDGVVAQARQFNEQRMEIAKRVEAANLGNIEELDFSDEAVRIAVANVSSNMMPRSVQSDTYNPSDLPLMLGEQVGALDEPSAELVSAVNFRMRSLERSEPQVAEIIRELMEKWNGPAVYAVLLNDLADGKTTVNSIVKLLSVRKELREKLMTNIYDTRSKGNPIAQGVSACLLENERDYEGILASGSDDAKIAVLGCARLIRGKIPVAAVAQFLSSQNKALAKAAEKYMESEDSPEARQVIYGLYPNQAKITGARFYFGDQSNIPIPPQFFTALFASVSPALSFPPYYYYTFNAAINLTPEEKLQNEVKQDESLLGIYAYDSNYVRIYADHAMYSWDEDDARYRERRLTDSEFSYLKSFMASNDVGNQPPFVSYCGGCSGKELLMLGRSGGRRIFFYTSPESQLSKGLDDIFMEFKRPPAKLKYWLEKDIGGLEILFAEPESEAKAVWKNGEDLRLLVNNTMMEAQIEKELSKLADADMENDDLTYEQADALDTKRRQERAFASYSWHRFVNGKLADFASQPNGVNFINKSAKFSSGYDDYMEEMSVTKGNIEVKTNDDELLKVVNGQTTKIGEGSFANGVISEGGKWLAITSYDYDSGKSTLIRINLQNNRQFTVKMDAKHRFIMPVAHLPQINKFLVVSGNVYNNKDASAQKGSFWFLDPETGTVTATNGEFRPIRQETYRSLQPTQNPSEAWAALPSEDKKVTEVGRYSLKTFTFTPVLKVPNIAFESMDMWVDEPANKIYVVYNGQLLGIPLKKPEAPAPAQ